MGELYEVVTYYGRRNEENRVNIDDKELKEKETHETG
jgi:hypothetical protein